MTRELKQLVKTRVDYQLGFWVDLWQTDEELRGKDFSVRWTGFVKAPQAGAFKLTAALTRRGRVLWWTRSWFTPGGRVRRRGGWGGLALTGKPQAQP